MKKIVKVEFCFREEFEFKIPHDSSSRFSKIVE